MQNFNNDKHTKKIMLGIYEVRDGVRFHNFWCEECNKEWDTTHKDLERVLDNLPDPDRLDILAEWIDSMYPNDKESGKDDVQNDLRSWAQKLRVMQDIIDK